MQFKLRDNSTGYYYLFSSKIVNLRDYGFVQSDTDWQLIQIPLNAFSPNTRVQTQYDEFEITFTATPIIELDWIVIQGSVINPSNQVTVKFIDGDNALDAVYTEGNVGVKTTTPTQALDVVGNVQIDEASSYMQDSEVILKVAKNGQSGYFSTWVGAGAGNASASATFQTALGTLSGYQNTGSSQTSGGYASGYQNTGASQTALGWQAGYINSGASQTSVGVQSGINNAGDNLISVGQQAGFQNIGDYNTFIGFESGADIARNTGAVQSFDGTDVNTTTEDITITAHGFGANGTYVNCLFTQGTAALGGIVNNTIRQFYIRDANTISGLEGTRQTLDFLDQLGTGHTLTPQYIYTNVTALGNDAQPTKDNQVTLGDANVVEVLTSGVVITGGYTVATLPTGVTGARAYVTDANATTFNSTVAAGGANVVPVFYNGTNWVIA